MTSHKYVLLAGGLGYIGSHIAVELSMVGANVLIVDNLSNCDQSRFDEIITICDSIEGLRSRHKIVFEQADLLDLNQIEAIFNRYEIEGVVALAGLKSVPESISNPVKYYHQNIGIMLNLLQVMDRYNCHRLIFSSSSTVYGLEAQPPLSENNIIGQAISNPYGYTKYLIEMMLDNLAMTQPEWQITSLRYFNPIGSYSNGLLADNPKHRNSNIMPALIRAFVNDGEFQIFGTDYATSDGSAERDYIHVRDLANAHVVALNGIKPGYHVYNVGLGHPISVLALVRAFEQYNGVKVRVVYNSRRPGDAPVSYTATDKITDSLGWTPRFNLEDMVRSSYKSIPT